MNELKAQDVKNMIDQDLDFVLVNVLSQEEFNKEHIPGSRNIPLKSPQFIQQFQQAAGGDKSKSIVVYCASTSCDASPTAVRKLADAGFSKVFDFAGGMQEWKEAGHPVETGSAATRS